MRNKQVSRQKKSKIEVQVLSSGPETKTFGLYVRLATRKFIVSLIHVWVVLAGFVGGFGWFWLVLGRFGWFWLVPCFSNYATEMAVKTVIRRILEQTEKVNK